jgi:hypothetical protein
MTEAQKLNFFYLKELWDLLLWMFTERTERFLRSQIEKALSKQRYAAMEIRKFKFGRRKMREKYKDEKSVLYFSERTLKKCQVFLFDKTVYKRSGELFDTKGERFMLVMDKRGNVFSHGERKYVQHFSFFSGKPVSFAHMDRLQRSCDKH